MNFIERKAYHTTVGLEQLVTAQALDVGLAVCQSMLDTVKRPLLISSS
jgi:hypothetical protein